MPNIPANYGNIYPRYKYNRFYNSHTQILRRKNLICNSCQCISVDQYDSHVKAIESIMLSSESVVATYFKRIDQRPL